MANVVYKPRGAALEYAPWASNVYQGCDNGCLYCYAPRVLHQKKEDFHECKGVRQGYFERLERECKDNKQAGKQVLLCFTSDPYQEQEKKLGATRRAVQLLHQGGANVTILTKCPSLALRDLDILIPGRDVIATTLTFTPRSWAKSLEWEPDAELPHQRIIAMEVFRQHDFEVWVSMEPVIEPEETLELIRLTRETFSHFKVGRLNYHPNDTDWDKFAHCVQRVLEDCGVEYTLKESLARYLI